MGSICNARLKISIRILASLNMQTYVVMIKRFSRSNIISVFKSHYGQPSPHDIAYIVVIFLHI